MTTDRWYRYFERPMLVFVFLLWLSMPPLAFFVDDPSYRWWRILLGASAWGVMGWCLKKFGRYMHDSAVRRTQRARR